MKKLFKFKSATKLALLSTAMISIVMVAFYALLYFTFGEREWKPVTPVAGVQIFLGMLIFTVPISYLFSALIIDRVLNPVRLMIEKVKSVGSRDFKSKIFIESFEDELTEYALAFNQMVSKLSEYDEKQKRFISDASHELVTPITVIVGHTDMLSRWGKDDPATLSEGLEVIKTEALSMNDLVENLLFFARTDNERMAYDKENIDLSSLLADCIAEQRLLRPDFTIVFHKPEPMYICADAEAVKRVLRILLVNSIKYSRETKQIAVEAESAEGKIKLRVSDQGIGIAPEYLRRIFDRFFRIDDSRTKETGGTGLGLAIAKEILDAHGYSIMAESTPGEGTTMIIEIPSL